MKITEQQLRGIIKRIISEAADEARQAPRAYSIDRNTASMAQKYLNHTGGYSKFSRDSSKPGLFSYGKELNYADSANQMQELVRKYNLEIRRLTTIYNRLIGRQATQWSDEQKAKAAQTRAFNKNYNQANPMATGSRYADAAIHGSVDPNAKGYMGKSLAGAQTDRAIERNQRARTGQNWFGLEENVEEGFFGNLFGKDEVNDICQNWKNYVGNQEAANKVLERIKEYKGVVQQLNAKIKAGLDRGHMVDTQAQYRKDRNAARKAAGTGAGSRTYAPTGTLEEAVARAIKKVLAEVKQA